MRCKICDWSPSSLSLFHEGLSDSQCSNRSLTTDDDGVSYFCTVCFPISYNFDEEAKDGEVPMVDEDFDDAP